MGRRRERERVVDGLRMLLPARLAPAHRLIDEVLAHATTTALAENDVLRALGTIDLHHALRVAGRAPPLLAAAAGEGDRTATEELWSAYRALGRVRAAVERMDERSESAAWAEAVNRLAGAKARLAKAHERARDVLSDAPALRVLARTSPAEALGYDLFSDEVLLVPFSHHQRLAFIVVAGSTTAEPRLSYRATASLWADAVRLLRDPPSDPSDPVKTDRRLRALRAVWFAPVRDLVAERTKLIVAGAYLPGGLPAHLGPPGTVVTHVSAPSMVAVTRRALRAGASGMVRVGAPSPGFTSLSVDELERADGISGLASLEPGVARSLDARPAVELLRRRVQEILWVGAPVAIEPDALERSRIGAGALTLGSLQVPARLLILSEIDVPAGAGRTPFALDAALAAAGFATTLVIPSTVPRNVANGLVDRVAASIGGLGPARAVAEAVRAAADPAALPVMLVGSPGLDGQRTATFAKQSLDSARKYAVSLLREGRYRDAVGALERWIRLQRAAGSPRYLRTAYQALVSILAGRLEPPDLAAAVDHQRTLVGWLEAQNETPGRVRHARLELANLYARAQDFERADELFSDLVSAADTPDEFRALAWYRFGAYERRRLEYEAAAQKMERAIELWERAKTYEAPRVPQAARAVLREVGELYLNRLSDPDRAEQAYLRARRRAKETERRLEIDIDLVRVARRRGDFDAAERRVRRARASEAARQLPEQDLSLVIEAANVAWYRGDYRRGAELCEESLSTADRLVRAAKKEATVRTRGAAVAGLLRRKVYALSVCGLLTMSLGDADEAVAYLVRARRLAERLGDEREVATQENNLGRVLLDRGSLEEAAEAFTRARAIDQRLNDIYALAYDLRNLGDALSRLGRRTSARVALDQALEFALQARDTNNELRARFALAELDLEEGRLGPAEEGFRKALPLSERLNVREITWQIHRALGGMARDQGDSAAAERALRRAVAVARAIRGRTGALRESPDRFDALDDLMRLLLDTGREREAFRLASEARIVEQAERLDDSRLGLTDEARRAMQAFVGATAEVTAEDARARLTGTAPRIAALLRRTSVQEVQDNLPDDGAVVVFRATGEELITYVVARETFGVHRHPTSAAALQQLVADYAERMSSRAPMREVHESLGVILSGRLASLPEHVRRLAIVPHRALSYVAFAALPLRGTNGAWIDRFELTVGVEPVSAARMLIDSSVGHGGRGVIAFRASAGPPLPFADQELTTIHEVFDRAQLIAGGRATRARWLEAQRGARGILHFAGHADLVSRVGGRPAVDPFGGQLRTGPRGVTMLDVMRTPTKAQLVVLSACTTLFGKAPGSGRELVSAAESFAVAGAKELVATLARVDDLAAALVVKHLYRGLRARSTPAALREAQRTVRKRHPHPAWWGTFVVVSLP